MELSIKGYECKHVVYSASQNNYDDLLTIKENIHYNDGSIKSNLRFIKNFERSFYLTYPRYRTHKTKKEFENIEHCQEFKSTERLLPNSVRKAIGYGYAKTYFSQLKNNPYIYGLNIKTPVIVKKMYMDKYPNCISENSLAVLDIETDEISDLKSNDINNKIPIYIGLTYKDKVFLGVLESFIKNIDNPIEKLKEKINTLLDSYIKDRNINLIIEVFKTSGQLCKRTIDYAHLWKPDFVAAWNIVFDLTVITNCLKRENYLLEDVFSDPSVPKEFRYFNYKPGRTHQITASGVFKPIRPAERWEKFVFPASFQLVDAMQVYKKIRIASQNEKYSLNYQLNKHLGLRKLNFDFANHVKDLDWHRFMQKNYPLEYGAYNVFDCIGVELLDEKNKDISLTLSTLLSYSELKTFESQPSMLLDRLHFFALNKGLVLGTNPIDRKEDLDDYIVGTKGWILTLATHLSCDTGLKLLEEFPQLKTGFRKFVADADLTSAYPSGQVFLNISRETTFREMVKISGLTKNQQKNLGLNLTEARGNALKIAKEVYKLPSLTEIDDLIKINMF
jgi:hypothetical protein